MPNNTRPNLRPSALRQSRKNRVVQCQPTPRRQDSSPSHFPRVLIPLDLSTTSQRGLHYVMQLPPSMVGNIWLLYVHRPDTFLSGLEGIPLVISDEVAFQRERNDLETILRKEVPPSRRGGTLIRVGIPDREIVKAVREFGIDLIVITTHAYHGLKHMMHPSVAEHVVRNAPCPVLVVNLAQVNQRKVLRGT